ncbi:MAG TPA: choice-of-anchor tandem repeat GloVer-containing protein [Candidatus Tumulicola sp.]
MRNCYLRFGIPTLTLALAACSWQGGTPPAGETGASSSVDYPAAHGGRYKTIYEFPGGAGGKGPGGGLAFVNGVMFGTTGRGGDVSGCDCGTVFAGTKVIYSFEGTASGDGAVPAGTLLPVGNKLYGMTTFGGHNGSECLGSPYPYLSGCGTIYNIDAAGNERVLYRFKGGSDGDFPHGGLVSLNGALYGVTNFGGLPDNCPENSYSAFPPGCGVIFAVNSSGRERVIYRFKGPPDAAYPLGKLLAFNGNLYGTTYYGGTRCAPYGCGTVFRVTPSGKESVIYSFKAGSDGQSPYGSLALFNGFLWGTTSYGGLKSGTVFKTSTSGHETVVYRFRDVPDGASPSGLLTVIGNTLYGTTVRGGTRRQANGTIFSATSKGAQTLHSFGARDGSPGGLVFDDSTKSLYGETSGGRYQAGTIFRYRP